MFPAPSKGVWAQSASGRQTRASIWGVFGEPIYFRTGCAQSEEKAVSMTLGEVVHGGLVHPRRVRVLAEHAARLIPPHSNVLDIGTGDGRIAAAVAERRSDIRIQGVDISVRPSAAIPVTVFDGRVIPMADDSVDVVTFFDVLHHTDDPTELLGEGARVARSCLVIKDHVCDSRLARALLSFMDDVGNKRHGVALPYNYWSSQ